MRLLMATILSMAALGTGVSASKPEAASFDGAFMDCENFRDSYICAYKLLVRRGSRVCGVQQDFATNRYYYQRFVGTVEGDSVRVEKICGDPGSETDTYCAGASVAPTEKVGWGTSDQRLFQCHGRLYSAKDGDPFSCKTARREAGIPKVRSLEGQGPESDDSDWLAACASGGAQ